MAPIRAQELETEQVQCESMSDIKISITALIRLDGLLLFNSRLVTGDKNIRIREINVFILLMFN